MSNIKVIRLGQTLDWDHSFNCSLKKYNGIDGFLDFSEYIKIYFENKNLLNKYSIKYSHCRIRHKGTFIAIDIFLQDLDFISKIVKNNSIRRLVLKRKRRKLYRYFGKKNINSNLTILRIIKKIIKKNKLYEIKNSKSNNGYYNINLKKIKIKNNINDNLYCNANVLGITTKKKKVISIFFKEVKNYLITQQIQIKKLIKNNNTSNKLKLKRYLKLKKIYAKYLKRGIKKFNYKLKALCRIYYIYLIKRYYKKRKFSIFNFKKKISSFIVKRSSVYKKYNKFLRRFKVYKKIDLLNIIKKRIGLKYLRVRYNDKYKSLRYYIKLYMIRYIDIENYLAQAGYKFFKKNVIYTYCILDNYIITSNIIVKYICERLKQGFFIGEILKDVEFVLVNSKDVLGFCIDCIGRFGRKRRTSFKRLSIRKLLKSKVNAIMDCSMDFVILRYGCCNVKVLLNKRENYREYRYKFRVY